MHQGRFYITLGRRSLHIAHRRLKLKGSVTPCLVDVNKRIALSLCKQCFILERFFATKAAATSVEEPMPLVKGEEALPYKCDSDNSVDILQLQQDTHSHQVESCKNNNITIHFRHAGCIVDIKSENIGQDLSLFTPKSDVFHLHRSNSNEQLPAAVLLGQNQWSQIEGEQTKQGEGQPDETSPAKHIQSVEEYQWREVKLDITKIPQYYLKLSKIRLTGLVVLTTMAGYAMAPGIFDPMTFAVCAVGTALTSCAANSINQFLEVPFDAQMNRTKNRVLVRAHLSSMHAVSFAVMSGMTGILLLANGVNGVTAALGAFNLVLYTMAYTPMKRLSVANTWIGSVVGGIPPMMGWAACTGGLEAGAWLMGAVLFAWQFPHFNALSWNLRPDYSRAGYRMMSVVDPLLCKRVALRYCLVTTGACLLAPVLNVTTWTFVADSLPLNIYLSYLGWRFYKDGDSKSSRKLFRFTLIHIPALMLLMLISKKSFRSAGDSKSVTTQHVHIQQST